MITIPPTFLMTPEIIELLIKIDANLIYLSSVSLPDLLKDKIRRTSILKSSLFSARIEGNTLTYERINQEDDETDEKKEIFNILKAVQFVESTDSSSKITLKTILTLHSLVLSGLSDDGGFFRSEPSAIFNAAGVAVYITPSPNEPLPAASSGVSRKKRDKFFRAFIPAAELRGILAQNKIPQLIKQMLRYSNSKDEKFPIVNAFISHLIFEKIHPFLDGNGRVGRLLVFAILKSKQKDDPFFIPFEEYLDDHKEEYYYHLDKGLKETNDYLVFMLGAFYEQTEKTKQMVADEMGKEQYLLTPRQEEIYNTIKDNRIVSLDEIKRRFMAVPKRTLSFDLKKLMDKGLVVKIGKTKGSYYQLGTR